MGEVKSNGDEICSLYVDEGEEIYGNAEVNLALHPFHDLGMYISPNHISRPEKKNQTHRNVDVNLESWTSKSVIFRIGRRFQFILTYKRQRTFDVKGNESDAQPIPY